MDAFERGLAERLASLPGVVAVTLGGSRAQGTHRPDSDWDFGLYYREHLDTDAVRALRWKGEVTEPGAWAYPMNGGAWLTIEGQRWTSCTETSTMSKDGSRGLSAVSGSCT